MPARRTAPATPTERPARRAAKAAPPEGRA